MASGMEVGKRPWYKRPRNLLILAVVLILLAAVLFPRSSPPHAQTPLDHAMNYFAQSYDPGTGLIPETPSSTTFWLYSDNFLSALAISRYDPTNQSMVQFGSGLLFDESAYAITFSKSSVASQYTVLNSTVASFNCTNIYTLAWQQDNQGAGSQRQGDVVKVATNDGPNACSSVSQNYADIMFLEAIRAHKLGQAAQESLYYQAAAGDFNGIGIADGAYANPTSSSYHLYQTYKLALYMYTDACTGRKSTDAAFPTLNSTLLSLQDKASGGFFASYSPTSAVPVGGVNTETTALAALALEAAANPSGSC